MPREGLLHREASRYARCSSGNYSILFAVLLVPLLMSVGLVVDSVALSNLKVTAANVTDASIMAAAATVREDGTLAEYTGQELQEQVDKRLSEVFEVYFSENAANISDRSVSGYTLKYDTSTSRFVATINMVYEPIFTSRFGGKTTHFQVSSEVMVEIERRGALSMAMVLDKSGSMGSNGRMTALKQAVASLASDFNKRDPKNELIRLGAWTYDSQMRDQSALDWNRAKAANLVQSLDANGGTSSTKAFQTAWQQVRHVREEQEHAAKNDLTLRKAILFMTDGDNNDYKDDGKTIAFYDKAKADEIEVYTVAFQAPMRGKTLLKACASSESHYFEATNSSSLIAAFRKIGQEAMGSIRFSH